MAGKRQDISALLAAREFKSLIAALEVSERSSIVLGETGGPLLDLYETADDIVIEADLPGMDTQDVEVYFLNNLLTIEGIKREKIHEAGKINYLCMERCFEMFKRVIKLSMAVNPRAAKAVYARGVLTLTIPKVKENRGQKVPVIIEKE